MPVPTHLRVVFRGTFKTTPETWSFGLKFSRDNPAGDDASLSDIDIPGMASACGTFFNTTAAKIPTDVLLTDVRGYIIGTDGRMEGNPEIVDVTSSTYDGAVAPVYPPQICLVMTHVAANRGPARFGRVFLPTAMGIGTDKRASTTDANACREAYTTFVKACSDLIDLELTQSAQQLNISDRGAEGTRQTVDHHEVGRVLDTLRSRRKGMLEERLAGGHIDW